MQLKQLALGISLLSICMAGHAGSVDTITVFSNAMQKTIKCVVISPSNYKKSSKKYPVLYLLHGYGGNYARWINVAPQLKDQVDALQLLIVCPDAGYGSWYVDSPADSAVKYETFTATELVNYIDSNYHTLTDRGHRAITGLSMGGHGALFLAARHKNQYGAAGSMSGLVDLSFFPKGMNFQHLFGDSTVNAANLKKYSATTALESLKNRELALTIDCGIYDFLIIPNRALHQKLLKLRIEHDYTERPGMHNAQYWRNSIDYHLVFFKKFFDKTPVAAEKGKDEAE